MIADLKPYPAYKESGLSWLGEVPRHWSVLPNRALFAEVKDRDHPDEEMLSVTITRGIVRQKALLAGGSKKDSSNLDKSAYKLVQPRDIAYNKMRAWQGAIGASNLRGIISPAYVVMRLRADENVPQYFHHLYRTPQFSKEAERWSYGITSDMWSLRPEHFKMIYAPEPPPAEQAAIVRFLNWTNGRLERTIRAKRQVIALLTEQKQAIIHRAVTRGLDPSVPLSPSGIPWLGEMPQHWVVSRVKSLARQGYKTFVDGDWIESPYIRSSGVRLIQTGNIGTGIFREKGFRYIDERTFEEFGCTEIDPNDVLICRLGDPVGRACLAPELGVRMITSVDVCILKTRAAVVPAFAVYLMSSAGYLKWVGSLVRGSTRDRVSRSMLGGFTLPLPPIEEQKAIVHHLGVACGELNTVISRLEREIALLREYRTRLVADVVTGKLDVREAAAGLPDEPSPEPSEDTAESDGGAELPDEEAAP
jgi:type I restriction enzyme S subunit